MDRIELARRLGATPVVGEPRRGPVVIEEREPGRFMAAFADAVAGGGNVFLADPAWGEAQRADMAAMLSVAATSPAAGGERGWLMIPSGGTSGAVKFARHDEETIGAAVRGFCSHFRVERVNAVGVLPLHHVSGLMAWMRCALSGGEYRPAEWKRIEAGERPVVARGEWAISLVPTQLQRLMASPAAVEWLRSFRVVFVGGAPLWRELADAAADARLPLSLGYGMTETAAMVTALRPEEFLAGARSSGGALPHASVAIEADGRVRIAGASLFRGYFPDWSTGSEFVAEDLGRIDERGHLHVLGRRDAMIITGGKKVHPGDVEAALRASGEFDDVAVLGAPDSEWGEVVVACYPAGRAPDVERASRGLLPWQRPKRFVAVADWPRNAQGKLNRAALREALR